MKTVRNYTLVTLFCVVFGDVYEYFSFGVYSNFMVYAFAWPFVFGLIPALLFAARKDGKMLESAPSIWPKRLWHTGVATLTVGSVFRGILDIYGTGSKLTKVYWIVGGVCLFLGLVTLPWRRKRVA